uniref:Uncharacterized protein n=1 Tax=Tetranychus urticae TaxID=32264 RepID=T1JVI8_TETUR
MDDLSYPVTYRVSQCVVSSFTIILFS